jgi:K+-sensing histidine kinase KdpD
MTVAQGRQLTDLLAEAIGPACHEMRSPLAVVYGFAKMLQSNDALDEQCSRYVDSVVTGAARLSDLLDALSQIGRIAAGRTLPTLEPVSLRPIVADVASAGNNGSKVTVEEGDDLEVHADPEWLAEAVRGVVDSCCFDDEASVTVSWTPGDGEVTLRFVPHSQYDAVDSDPVKAGVAFELAKVRFFAMGGALTVQGGSLLAAVPVRNP